jgi:hypothetical protein
MHSAAVIESKNGRTDCPLRQFNCLCSFLHIQCEHFTVKNLVCLTEFAHWRPWAKNVQRSTSGPPVPGLTRKVHSCKNLRCTILGCLILH